MRIDDLTTLIEGIDSISDIHRIQSLAGKRKLELYTMAELDPSSDHANKLARLNHLIDTEGNLRVDILKQIIDWFDIILYERVAIYIDACPNAVQHRMALREGIVSWLRERHIPNAFTLAST